MSALHLLISGKVQGVYYRASCQQEARALGLKGWVKNLDDGRVEAHVEGDADDLERLLAWCQHGPANSRVDRVDVNEVVAEDFASFDVPY